MSLKVDLHCHTYYSDGKHSPAFLIERAINNGLTHLAITDHDSLAAYREIESNAELCVVPGVELSTGWNGMEIHVVGIGLDVAEPGLQELITAQQLRRRERIDAFDTRLAQLGIFGLADYIKDLPCHSYTRSHVADFLIANGHSKNYQKAFKKYLSRKGKAYVAAQWIDLASAVQVLRAAGGIAVLAHPGHYSLSRSKLQRLLGDFKAAGGEAMETSYGNVDPALRNKLTELALQFDLYLSQGSDFHTDDAHWTDLGKYPGLGEQAKKNAIWLHPGWHFSNP